MLCRSLRLPCCAGVFFIIQMDMTKNITKLPCYAGVFSVDYPCCAGVYSSHTYDQTHIRLPCCAVAIDYRVVPESLRMVRLPCCAGALYYRNCVNFSIFINLGPFEMLLFLWYNYQSQFWVDISSLINKFVSDTDCRATRIRFILKSQSLFTFLQKRG